MRIPGWCVLGGIVLGAVACEGPPGWSADAGPVQIDARGPDAVFADAPPFIGEDVATGILDPVFVAVDNTHVFFTYAGGSIGRVPSAGGALETIATAQRGPTSLEVSTNRVFWVNTGTHANDFLDGSVRWADKTGGDNQLATSYFPVDLAIDGDQLFWVEVDGQRVMRIGTDGTGAMLIDDQTSNHSVALTAATLYWIGSGGVVAMNRATGTRTVLATTEYAGDALALYGTDVFWTTRIPLSDYGAIRVSRAGAAPVDLVSDEYYPTDLVQDGDWLYWIGVDRIRRAHRDGAPAQTVVANRGNIGGLAFDAGYLYWSELDRGAIVRMPK